ncbi:hypothetical protein BP5796_12372 [Coleophoma crateriformis]|uniref:DUF7923 domain-containing protein n=1 Tax=Coleophoma crateriformis TaxID=565419 RepID=A0A3D8Q9C1_9HELO|nr:hypothetical protein BP5796_12372 [Coleophoma crateriformis]
MASLDAFREEYDSLNELERKKNRLIENLLTRVEELQDGLRDMKLHLEREQATSKTFQSRFYDAEFMLKTRDEKINFNSFVSVLIDGDCMPFLDRFVKSAQQGGMEAARCLRSAVYDYVTRVHKLPANIQIRVRIYANTAGLASAYLYNKILFGMDNLKLFICGFNMGHPMCDFVDAGDGKECADTKLKAWFNQDMADVQCQAVVFGGSPDDGYARLLQPYVGDNSKSNRIILVEGHPFARELAGLKEKFFVAHFPDIFRNAKLPSRGKSDSPTSTPTPIPNAFSYATAVSSIIGGSFFNTNDTNDTLENVPALKANVLTPFSTPRHRW